MIDSVIFHKFLKVLLKACAINYVEKALFSLIFVVAKNFLVSIFLYFAHKKDGKRSLFTVKKFIYLYKVTSHFLIISEKIKKFLVDQVPGNDRLQILIALAFSKFYFQTLFD